MKKFLAASAILCAAAFPAKADDGCAYRLVSFTGLTAVGFNSLASVEPGDVLLSVTSANTSDSQEYISSFLPEVQVQLIAGSPPQVLMGIQQISGVNLSSQHFVALLCRQPRAGRK